MNTRGFTLIEMMVAVTIVAIAATGPLMAASRAYVAAQIARDQVTASYLSQEAIEFARLKRDDAFLTAYHTPPGDTSGAWGAFLSDINTENCAATMCTFDPPSGDLHSCGSGTSNACVPLYLATTGTTKLYTQNGGPGGYTGAVPTPFTRTVQFYAVAGTGPAFTQATEVRVTATTTWQSHGQTRVVVVSDNLTPWQ